MTLPEGFPMTRSWLAVVCSLIALASAGAQTAEIQGRIDTARYVLLLESKEGGFVAAGSKPGDSSAKPSLRATSAAVRALKYLGVKLPYDKAGCVKLVKSCFDPATGGFKDTPTSKPDVFSTAVGLMAVAELSMPIQDYRKGALTYLTENVKTVEDIRIAVAGTESIAAVASAQDEWLEKVIRKRNPDGTWGGADALARDTGSALVAVLRMKGPVVERERVLKGLKDGQRRDGGFGKADADGSDLESTYRVIRAFKMLKAQPADVEGVRSFVAKCRNDDHGYGVRPNEPSSVGATYFAAIINHWLAPN
jgi:prenyltransferase beta subunit